MNSGERDELIFKLVLVYLRDNGGNLFNKPITSVGFGFQEYGKLPSNYNLNNLNYISELELSDLCYKIGAGKSPTGAKADVYINGTGFSLKSLQAAPPALVNHTSRPGFEFACFNANTSINILDQIIASYWQLRKSGQIAEDTKNCDLICPFVNFEQYMTPILNYFLFYGTGSKLSPYPAEYILEFDEPCNPNTYRLLTKNNAVHNVWPKLIFSLRAKKGMPNCYDKNTYCGPNASSIAKWVEYIDGDYRGALHIRSSR